MRRQTTPTLATLQHFCPNVYSILTDSTHSANDVVAHDDIYGNRLNRSTVVCPFHFCLN